MVIYDNIALVLQRKGKKFPGVAKSHNGVIYPHFENCQGLRTLASSTGHSKADSGGKIRGTVEARYKERFKRLDCLVRKGEKWEED